MKSVALRKVHLKIGECGPILVEINFVTAVKGLT